MYVVLEGEVGEGNSLKLQVPGPSAIYFKCFEKQCRVGALNFNFLEDWCQPENIAQNIAILVIMGKSLQALENCL